MTDYRNKLLLFRLATILGIRYSIALAFLFRALCAPPRPKKTGRLGSAHIITSAPVRRES